MPSETGRDAPSAVDSLPGAGSVPAAKTAPQAAETAAQAAETAAQLLQYREAFDQALSDATAIGKDELVPVNIEVASAMATVLEALPKIFAYREQAAKLPDFDISDLDQLQVRTFALGHAHAKFVAASAPPEALAGLNEQGVKLRDTMYSDAVALSHRGLISGARIAKFRGNAGYKNLALSLLGLATLLRDSWDEIASRSGLQLDELDEAERLGRQLLDAVALREQARALVAELQVQRQRNFTLFSRSYNQVRRVICYLRWNHNDGDQICPSLYAGRGGRRRKVARALATSLGD